MHFFIHQPFFFFWVGYDVFLGNFRGLVSREHVNKNISSQQYVLKIFIGYICTHKLKFAESICGWATQSDLASAVDADTGTIPSMSMELRISQQW